MACHRVVGIVRKPFDTDRHARASSALFYHRRTTDRYQGRRQRPHKVGCVEREEVKSLRFAAGNTKEDNMVRESGVLGIIDRFGRSLGIHRLGAVVVVLKKSRHFTNSEREFELTRRWMVYSR